MSDKKTSHVITYEDGLEVHTFNHPDFGQLRAFKDANGKVNFALPDVCKALGMTEEEALKQIRLEDLRTVDELKGEKITNH
ncbi:MAG: hypothetical protein LBS60_05450 [Deltaproteobacteria bacterium]|jgi:prophage antirepressor-like protein|nr:hypothetical protein [Deltaproteobacteria bacterium]